MERNGIKLLERTPEAQVGDRITGRCVTLNTEYTGTVAEVIGPIRIPDCGGYRYKITDTGKTYFHGGPVEPIVYYSEHAAPQD